MADNTRPMMRLQDIPTPELPTMDAWKARSFWLTLIAAAAAVSVVVGFDLFGLFGVEDAEGLVDLIMPVVSGIAAILALRERLWPKTRLVFGGGVVK